MQLKYLQDKKKKKTASSIAERQVMIAKLKYLREKQRLQKIKKKCLAR